MQGVQCYIILIGVHSSTEITDDDIEDKFYGLLKPTFDKYVRHHMKIFLGDFHEQIGKEKIY